LVANSCAEEPRDSPPSRQTLWLLLLMMGTWLTNLCLLLLWRCRSRVGFDTKIRSSQVVVEGLPLPLKIVNHLSLNIKGLLPRRDTRNMLTGCCVVLFCSC
jgi:hypothetical protein